MKKETFTKILSSKTQLDMAQTKELQVVLQNFPYFQAARAIQLKGLHQNHSFSYNAALKKTAAYTTDRSVLFDYITSEEFKQHNISKIAQARQKKPEKTEAFEEAVKMNQEEAGKVLDPGLFEKTKKPTRSADRQESTGVKETTSSQDQPRDFNKTQEHSFSEWLKLTSASPVSREDEKKQKPQKLRREDMIIDKFIENNPKITPSTEPKNHVAIKSNEPGNHLMTETLARIYAEQKNYEKAIQAYKILILKNPEKSGLFADRIRAIELSKENKNK